MAYTYQPNEPTEKGGWRFDEGRGWIDARAPLPGTPGGAPPKTGFKAPGKAEMDRLIAEERARKAAYNQFVSEHGLDPNVAWQPGAIQDWMNKHPGEEFKGGPRVGDITKNISAPTASAPSPTPSTAPAYQPTSIYPNVGPNGGLPAPPALPGVGTPATNKPVYMTPSSGSPMTQIPSFDPSAGNVTTPGTMPNYSSPSIKRNQRPNVGGFDQLGLGDILPNQGTTRSGYQPNRRRYF